MSGNDDFLLASRPASSSPFGKCTEEVKARIPYEIKEGFARIANEIGMTESELLREMVMVKVLGVDVVRSMQEKRLQLIIGEEKNSFEK